jgi:hypothetical protein
LIDDFKVTISTADLISYTANLQGFKSSKSAQNFYLLIEIKLLPYHFQVKFNQAIADFSYSDLSTFEAARKGIVSSLVKQLIEDISRHTSS